MLIGRYVVIAICNYYMGVVAIHVRVICSQQKDFSHSFELELAVDYCYVSRSPGDSTAFL